MTKSIPVFYHDEQVHDACSYSKSPLKPGLMARRLALDPAFTITGNDGPDSLIYPVAADRLSLTHDPAHVKALIAGEKADGFGNKSKKDNRAIRMTVGNYLVAAEWAVAGKREDGEANIIHPGVVWSLTSGFHHAHYASCHGFCTYNALNLAAAELWKFRGVKSLIIDGDAHYGDGCADIIRECGQGEYLRYLQLGVDHGAGWDRDIYIQKIERAIEQQKPGLIMYQAGADAWVGDPLNCGGLTMDELYQRDLATLMLAKRHDIPIVVNLAGGYADNYEDTLLIHMNTGEAMKEVFLGRGCATIPEKEMLA